MLRAILGALEGNRFPPNPSSNALIKKDSHTTVHQLAEEGEESEDHRVLKGLFCLHCYNTPTKTVLSERDNP